MVHRNPNRKLRPALALLAAAAVTLTLVACGGSSDQANQLLRQTFAANHRVESGRLGVILTITPSSAGRLRGPLTLSLGGPFQSLGPARPPASAFNISLAAKGTRAAATITTIGSAAYVTFRGQSYQLPHATFQRLESTFAGLASAPGRGRRSGMLGRLGIQPQAWLLNPHIVGHEGIQGIDTTHVRSGIDVAALLANLNTFLQRASSLGIAGAGVLPQRISAADRRQIAREAKSSTVNVWTGVADKTLRRLQIDLTVPVSGQMSALLGRSAAIALTMQYADLNRPQTITAPTKVLPYSEFQAKLPVVARDIDSGLVSGGSGPSPGG